MIEHISASVQALTLKKSKRSSLWIEENGDTMNEVCIPQRIPCPWVKQDEAVGTRIVKEQEIRKKGTWEWTRGAWLPLPQVKLEWLTYHMVPEVVIKMSHLNGHFNQEHGLLLCCSPCPREQVHHTDIRFLNTIRSTQLFSILKWVDYSERNGINITMNRLE